MDINYFLSGATINDIDVIRGLGIIPARLVINIEKNHHHYAIEAELNFRVIYKNKMILCFDDMFLDKENREISPNLFKKQKDLEYTLLNKNMITTRKKIVGKMIDRVRSSSFGDYTIYISRYLKIQIINDSHLIDSVIFRVLDLDSKQEYVAKNDKTYYIPISLFEVINSKNNTIVIKEQRD